MPQEERSPLTMDNQTPEPRLPRFTALQPATSHSFAASLPASKTQRPARITGTQAMNQINNAISCIIVAAVFAMIGLEAGNQPGMTHSGTQQVCPVHPSIHPDCRK